MSTAKLHASIIVTYRCNAHCGMCDTWKRPSKPDQEIGPALIRKLPKLFFANVTGGEPFVRRDLVDLIGELRPKARRIVISTNGHFTDRILELCRQYPDIGIRISLEGLPKANDTIRGIPDGFDRAFRTLMSLRANGLKDIGFAMTVQDANYGDLLPLYYLAKALRCEFATATVHNSHYFHKHDNEIVDKPAVCNELKRLAKELLRSGRIKDWFRAYFNWGLVNYIFGNERLLPCDMGRDGFFLSPSGNIVACNGMAEEMPIGNLNKQSWQEIWQSEQAEDMRRAVGHCRRNCWMIGSAAPAMLRHLGAPMKWVLRNKLRLLLNRDLEDINQCRSRQE